MKKAWIILALALAACGVKSDKVDAPGIPMLQKLTPAELGVGTSYYSLTEACYDGVVYLITARGGITPKVSKSSLGLSFQVTESPFIGCK